MNGSIDYNSDGTATNRPKTATKNNNPQCPDKICFHLSIVFYKYNNKST